MNLFLSAILTYVLLLGALFLNWRALTGRARFIVTCIGVAALALLTWILVDNAIMDYQDANIGLGLVFFLVWGVTLILLLVAVVLYGKRSWKK